MNWLANILQIKESMKHVTLLIKELLFHELDSQLSHSLTLKQHSDCVCTSHMFVLTFASKVLP